MNPKEIELKRQIKALKEAKVSITSTWEKQIKDFEAQREDKNEQINFLHKTNKAQAAIIYSLRARIQELQREKVLAVKAEQRKLEPMTLRKNELKQQNEALTRQNKNLRRRLELLQSDDVQAVLSVIEKFKEIMR